MTTFHKWPSPNIHDASDQEAPKPEHIPPMFNPSGVHDASNPDPSTATTITKPATARPAKPEKR